MKKEYKYYTNVTKPILDSIHIGQLIKINDWKKPMKVIGVSKNYFVMIQNNFGTLFYSVCEKKPWSGIRYNAMIGGKFHCGKDNMIFGWFGNENIDFDYKFEDEKQIKAYLQAFENGDIELSMRGTIPIVDLHVK